jgi:hypothetical protein
MQHIPYHPNPGNACALACYTMVGQYLLPDEQITFDQLSATANRREGYVVWEFPIWKWLMDRGVHITDYDVIDYHAWAKDGVSGLQNSVPADEFAWYKTNTYDLNEVTEHIQTAFDHPNFSFHHRKPTWDDVLAEYNKPGICDIVLNSKALNHEDGFAAHRVVLIEVTDSEVVFHDPNSKGDGAYRREPVAHFRKAFETIASPALARYSLAV